jgi:hypothetical protein
VRCDRVGIKGNVVSPAACNRRFLLLNIHRTLFLRIETTHCIRSPRYTSPDPPHSVRRKVYLINIIPTRPVFCNSSATLHRLPLLKAVSSILSDHCHCAVVMRTASMLLGESFSSSLIRVTMNHQRYLWTFPWQRTSGDLACPFVIAFLLSACSVIYMAGSHCRSPFGCCRAQTATLSSPISA